MKYTKEYLSQLLMKAYLDARKNERNTNSQLRFELDLENNLKSLCDKIWNRTYKPSPPFCFIIDTPREIFAPQFKDRIVSHLIFNMTSPLFDPLMIYDSYSCRKEKGTLFGIERLEHHLRSCTENFTKRAYVLCLDISGYFMSINKDILYKILCDTLDKHRSSWETDLDYDLLDFLIRGFLFRDPTEGAVKLGKLEDWDKLPPYKSLFNSKPGIGLMIGDVTSQLFSNIYLNYIDQYAKKVLRCKHYGRYVDDIRIIDRDKEKLKTISKEIEEELNRALGLQLNPRKTRIIRADRTVDFLGADLLKGNRYASAGTLKRFSGKYKNSLIIPSDHEISSINSYLGYLKHFKSDKLVGEVIDSVLEKEPSLEYIEEKNKVIIKKNK